MTSLVLITAENQQDYLGKILEIETLSFPAPWSAGAFIQEINNPIGRLCVAAVNGKAVGFVCYWIPDFEVSILDLAVHPEERGKGIGRFLLNHVVEEAALRRVEAVWLEVRASNAGAITLYGKFGFEKTGVRRKYYDDTQEDAVVMCLRLPGSSRDILRASALS
jgi:[ribosomal protein S18]-alanine N-acetyltransferase